LTIVLWPLGEVDRAREIADATVARIAKLTCPLAVAAEVDCDACALKPKCCPSMAALKIARSIYESARDKTRAILKTEPYAISRRARKKVERWRGHRHRSRERLNRGNRLRPS
jgi:hypothetical protein